MCPIFKQPEGQKCITSCVYETGMSKGSRLPPGPHGCPYRAPPGGWDALFQIGSCTVLSLRFNDATERL